MDFFQPIQSNPNATQETLENKRVAWNKGLSGDNNPQKGVSRPRQSSLMKQYWAKIKDQGKTLKSISKKPHKQKVWAPTHTTYVYHTPAGIFNIRGEAMTANNVTLHTLASRCESKNFPDWFKVFKGRRRMKVIT